MCVRCLGLIEDDAAQRCGLWVGVADGAVWVLCLLRVSFIKVFSQANFPAGSENQLQLTVCTCYVHLLTPTSTLDCSQLEKKVLVCQSCFARTRNEPCRPLRPRRHQRKRRCHRHRGISSNLGRRAGERRRHLEEDWKPDPAEDGGEPRRGGSSVDVFGIPRRRFDQRDGDCCGWWVDNSSRDLARRSGELV